jgi:riboflavin kinase/FMN adenylyltransferase
VSQPAATTATTAPRVVAGTVVAGDRRGRELGFPTANIRLDPDSEVPAFGVYAARVDRRAAAVSIGVRPTFGDGLEPLLEAHLLDYSGDLYGRELSVQLLAYLRPERRFDSVEALVEQMNADVAAVRAVLEPPAGQPAAQRLASTAR